MESVIKIDEISPNIAQIVLNRPKALNALNTEMLEELLIGLNNIEKSAKYRAVIISGAGNNFVAGADIKGISKMDTVDFENYIRLIQEVTWRLEKLPILTVAAIDGIAFGGGFELALACDFRFATPNARFALPEIKLGLMPGAGGTYRLTKLIGLSKAKRILYTGSTIKAEQSKELGIVEKITNQESLIDEAIEFCEEITGKSIVAFKAIKESASQALEVDTYAARQMETLAITSVFTSDDCKEGIQAFIEKRKPQFTGS